MPRVWTSRALTRNILTHSLTYLLSGDNFVLIQSIKTAEEHAEENAEEMEKLKIPGRIWRMLKTVWRGGVEDEEDEEGEDHEEEKEEEEEEEDERCKCNVSVGGSDLT